jgi:hypothetical protein
MQQKQYGAYYNTSLHLHITSDPKISKGRPRGDWPPLSELKKWIKEVYVSLVGPKAGEKDYREEEESDK